MVAEHAAAVLTVDLGAIVDNFRLLRARLNGTSCAGVVKADGYGLGAVPVARSLWQAGCRSFFVATVDEGIELRGALPDGEIFVLNGLGAGGAAECAAHTLVPVLNSLGEIGAWQRTASDRAAPLATALHVDTGMSRLGLPAAELDTVAAEPERLSGLAVGLVMSHLACPDEPEHPDNPLQLAAFRRALAMFRPEGARTSLASSSAVFLGPEYHFDLARPGAALYGLRPTREHPNPLRSVVRLQGKILQLRDVDTGTPVGYGATHRFARPARLATVGVGYADGYLRSLSNRGSAVIAGRRVPVVGRVSMDLITLDVSDVPAHALSPGAVVDLIGPDNTVDELADQAGTIGYEILTSLGRRYARHYLAAGEPS